jgi:hypothetical protein
VAWTDSIWRCKKIVHHFFLLQNPKIRNQRRQRRQTREEATRSRSMFQLLQKMTFPRLRITLLLALLVFLTEHNNFVSSADIIMNADIMMNAWSVSLDRRPFPSKKVVVGDSITFKLLGPHDVWIFPSRTCEEKIDKILVGSRKTTLAGHCSLPATLEVIVKWANT